MITRAVVRVLTMCSPDYFKSRQTDRVTLWDPHEWTPQKLAIPVTPKSYSATPPIPAFNRLGKCQSGRKMVFVRFGKCIVVAEFVFFLKSDYFLMSRAVTEPANLNVLCF